MRRYSNNAAQTTLSAAANAADTTITVSAVTGFPAPDFVLALDYGTASQELVLVTGVAGTTLTVTRGYDNTTAISHDVGAAVVHTHSAADFADSRNHEAAATGVHGVTGAVVGTTDTQALSHKDLTDPTNTFPGSLTTDAELSAHAAATTGVHGVGTGAVVGTTEVQALTNKDLTDASNTFPSSLATDTEVSTAVANHAATTTGVHGVGVGNVVGTAATQTLTNKTLAGPSMSSPTITDKNIHGVLALVDQVRCGTVGVSSVAPDGDVNLSVTFNPPLVDSDFPTTPPIVLLTPQNGRSRLSVAADNVTKNGFTLNAHNYTTISAAGCSVAWFAYLMTS